MTEPETFGELLMRLNDQDEGAAAAVVRRFTRRLIGLVRSQLDTWIRRKEDPEDVVQSVFRAFLRGYQEGNFAFESPDDLWSLLALITVRKCADRVDYYRAACRDLACEAAHPGGPISWDACYHALDREPTPDDAAILAETVDQLLRILDADDRLIIQRSLEGFTTQEISQDLGFSERTVRRVRERVKCRLLRMRTDN
jgi:RNA polymerase sigma-70 factor (ECF subfamily)